MNREPHHRAEPFPPSFAMRPDSRYDDDDIDHRRRELENPTSAGMIGFILSMVSLGLVIVVAVLWFAMNAEDEQQVNHERRRLLLYWFMILDIASFFIAMAATLFAARGVTPTNPLFRGWGMTALILGIFEMLFTAFAALVLTCFVLVAEMNRAGG